MGILNGAPLVFFDTETTGLNKLGDHIWEIGAIRREAGSDTEHHLFVQHDLTKLEGLPPRFRDDHDQRFDASAALTAEQVAQWTMEVFSAGAHMVGANVAFDMILLERLLRGVGVNDMPWNYHPVDVETIAIGTLLRDRDVMLPWRSDSLAEQTGLAMNDTAGRPRYRRHTALDDARWVRDWYDQLTLAAD